MIRPSIPSSTLGPLGLAVLAGLLGLLSLLPAPAAAESSEEPRLRLAIDRPVHEGERLSLHWEGASDDVEELEILLSVDGGRTYAVCISPSLDPRTGKYEWTVPNLGGSRACLRIRFRRDGRELEGEPTPLSSFLTRGCDLPESALLPRDADSENERAPKPGGARGPSSPVRGDLNPGEGGENWSSGRSPAAVNVSRIGILVPAARPCADLSRSPSLNTLPRFLPPRK